MQKKITVIGAGLAGCEAAWQIASQEIDVDLYEMRPRVSTGAHQTALPAELVCSNSLGSALADRATGVLQQELRTLRSLLIHCADDSRVPAGGALAVDRERFSQQIAKQLDAHPHIRIIREEVVDLPSDGMVVLATGPLTSPAMSDALCRATGEQHLFFFDALAPIVSRESIDFTVAFEASRYGRGEQAAGDYINCPLNREEYQRFISELVTAERIPPRAFEMEIETGVQAGDARYFESCLPIEVLAQRGEESLAFGPMRPVGLTDPRSGRRPHAVLQLRQDNLAASLYNLVGFQTNLKYGEQQRIFRMIPGLQNAEFIRYGHMHRNTFLAAPRLLRPSLEARFHDRLFVAGQLCGIEGYAGNIGSGLIAGQNAARHLRGLPPLRLPRTTMLGCLIHYITHIDMATFQPMKANFGIMPALEGPPLKGKRQRAAAYAERAARDLGAYVTECRKD
ncbi:MAG: methylenetetrahydrofolate--tRNA-(uracil(54)-C(5))-methyltransferase (FADH(2)-oxidizing) TrmFO [Spartobacteria bacterium]|nr:methylenetetrahydrofolate--tRNA-(uracil(54)-C(5))-methyltransferase (FADH(2)-oxidizing) TrmFO [Spartobacteria bacterium]